MQSKAIPNPILADTADKESAIHPLSKLSPWNAPSIFLLASLFILVLVTRIPFRTEYLFNWDSANFALALRDFDVTRHAPHPPGYPYFVLAGKALQGITGEANSALVLESIIISALAVIALMALGQAMFSKTIGLVAALLLTGSVTFWTYGEIALAYTSLALFSSLGALFAYQTIFLGKDRGIHLALAYSVGSGFRPDLLLFLAPLLLVSCLRLPIKKAILVIAIAIAGVLLWLVPTMLLSGGVSSYIAVMQAYLSQDVIDKYSSTSRGVGGLVVNIRDTASYLFYSLYGTSVLFLALIASWALRLGRGNLSTLRPGRGDLAPTERVLDHHQMTGKREVFILLWLAPMAVFYLIVHIGDPGYIFSILPAVLLLLSYGLVSAIERLVPSSKRNWALGAVVISILLLNTGIFVLHQRPLTSWGLRQNDQAMEAKLELLSSRLTDSPPLALFYDSYKHVQFYLPDYKSKAWIDTAVGAPAAISLPPGTREILLMDNSLVRAGDSLSGQEIEIAKGYKVKIVSAENRNTVKYDGHNLTLE